MKYTNKADLPQGIVDAIMNDEYDIEGADYSLSSLAQPPQARRLVQYNSKDIVIDVSDEIWKLFGSAVHAILDRGQKPKVNHYGFIINQLKTAIRSPYELNTLRMHPINSETEFGLSLTDLIMNHDMDAVFRRISDLLYSPEPEDAREIFTEKRYFMDIAGYRLTGKPDWYDRIKFELNDYKVTSVWKITKGDTADWQFQLNGYKMILEANGLPVKHLQINAILKDWKKFEFQQNRDPLYPSTPVAKVEIEMWHPLDTLQIVIDKIRDHESLKGLSNAELIYKARPCTKEEKWGQPDKYAVMKIGNKKASKVFDTSGEAAIYCGTAGADYIIEKRVGEDKRCEEFCLAKPFCKQYKAEHGKIYVAGNFGDDAGVDLLTLVPETLIIPIKDDEKDANELADSFKGINSAFPSSASEAQDGLIKKDEDLIDAELKKLNSLEMTSDEKIKETLEKGFNVDSFLSSLI